MLAPFRQLLKKAGGSGGGMYTLLDRDGFYYAPHRDAVLKIADVAPGGVTSRLTIAAQIDMLDHLPDDYRSKIKSILGTNITYDGYIVLAMPGLIAVTDRAVHAILVSPRFPGKASRTASPSTTRVASTSSPASRCGRWSGPARALSMDEADGAWAAAYDIGPHNPKSLSNGSGATPTLIGFGDDEDKLVLIPDADDPVKLVAFWRDEIPADFTQKPGTKSRRIADQIALTIPAIGTVEWSLHGARLRDVADEFDVSRSGACARRSGHDDWLWATLLTMADTREGPRGVEKFEWNPKARRFERRWRNNAQLQWGLHPMSSATNTVHVTAHEDGVFKLIGLDWDTGEQVADISLGASRMFNVAGGFMQPLPSGDLFVSGYFGPVLVRKAGSVRSHDPPDVGTGITDEDR